MFGYGFLNIESTSLLVEKLVNGQIVGSGNGGSFFVNPKSTFRAIPVTSQNVSFNFEEATRDSQKVRILGSVSVNLLPQYAVKLYDFSINKKNGQFLQEEPLRDLKQNILGLIRTSIRDSISENSLNDLLVDVPAFEEQLRELLAKIDFQPIGVTMGMFTLDSVKESNNEVANAREAKAREEFLTTSQQAIAKRRREAAKDDRELRRYEAETNKQMAMEEAELIAVENENLIKRAEAEAKARQIKLEPFTKIERSAGFLSVLSSAAENIDTLNIGADVLEQFIGNKITSKNGR